MNENSHPTSEADWLSWKTHCAARLCPPETEASLKRFGTLRGRGYLQQFASGFGRSGNRSPILAEAEHAWHWLETYAAVGTSRQGKRYKDWLFARAEQGHDWLAMVEAGASMLLRDAVREQLRREHAPKFMVSLQQPMGEGLQGTCTLEELIPDQVSPTDSTTDWEWQQLALTHAQRCYPTLTETEKLVLWARDQGYTLNDPQLAERGKVSMNVLYRTYRSVVTRISLELKADYPGESPASLIQLARLVLEQIALRLNSENFCQKDPSGFLMEVE